jgi:hypothetical protein
MVYLEERARNAKSATKTSKPVSASWLAILFAVLAVGSQYHDSPYHIRTTDSQKYIQISFHFLRLGNFLLRYVILTRNAGVSVLIAAGRHLMQYKRC